MMKNKQFNEPKSGLFPVVVARETHYMLVSMLEYHQENRPTLASLLSHPMFMWPGDNEQEIALEGLSEKWKKKY